VWRGSAVKRLRDAQVPDPMGPRHTGPDFGQITRHSETAIRRWAAWPEYSPYGYLGSVGSDRQNTAESTLISRDPSSLRLSLTGADLQMMDGERP
jgi:hypothetical protein